MRELVVKYLNKQMSRRSFVGNLTKAGITMGLHPAPDCKLMFKNAAIGAGLLTPPINWLRQINAQKDFVLSVDGPEDLTNWFAQTVMMAQTAGLKFGTPMPDGSMRYCNMLKRAVSNFPE